jgi:hypothetical protein
MNSDHIIQIPQWGSEADWDEANTSIAHLVRIHRSELGEAIRVAEGIRDGLETLFPLMDEFCGKTCVVCPSPCCVTATVWIDYWDLLFLHLCGLDIPSHQLIEKQPESCRYGSAGGCLLPRLSRPWVCTLYMCPPQMALLREKAPDIRKPFDEVVKTIKADRKRLEELFLDVVK